jgi:HEAT repeat protein
MNCIPVGIALVAAATLGNGSASSHGPRLEATAGLTLWAHSLPSTGPRAWLRGDPADSLYRAAREALNHRDYRTAATLFEQIPIRFPRSGYAADALYWQAFALYRLGGDRELRMALDALRRQQERFPQAATRGDAATLERRIQGELARHGDIDAATEIAAAAQSAAEAAPVSAVAPAPPAPPAPPAASHGSACAENDDDMKVAALNALQRMDQAKALPVLRRVLARRDAASVCLRRKAVFLVAQQNEPGTEDLLLASVRTDPDSEVRRQSVFWLSQVGTDRAVVALDSILRFSQDREIQDRAVFALSQQNSPKAQLALRTYAERTEVPEAMREKAIFWIGQHQTPDNATFLRSLYGRLKSEELKKKIFFSLSQMGGEENGRWLLGIARDTAQGIDMRKQALFWAGQGGVSLSELIRLYDNVKDPAMREQLIFVYSQRNESQALDKLIEIAKRDSSPELRKRALFWVGQSDDSRAVQAIQEIIDQP